MPLRADDLEPGLFITISRGRVEKHRHWGEGYEEEHDGQNGSALIVLAVALPFIVVGILANADGCLPPGDSRVTLDTRKFRFSRLTEEYVYAITRTPAGEFANRLTQPGPVRVVGVKDPEYRCPECGGPDPFEHAKRCSRYQARRK